MTTPQDPRVAFINLVSQHLTAPGIQKLAKIVCADQFQDFWLAPFGNGQGRWDREKGLAEATLVGYQALRILCHTATSLYHEVNADRMVTLYLILMVSRWRSLTTGEETFKPGQAGSMTTVAVCNAIALGERLTVAETQALTCWHYDKQEMSRNHESFTPEWWTISQTMWWLFTANRK